MYFIQFSRLIILIYARLVFQKQVLFTILYGFTDILKPVS